MKIMFIAAAKSIHTMRWVQALLEKGNDVILVSQRDHYNGEIDSRIKCEYLKYSGTKGYYLNAITLRKIYKKHNPDVVNVHYASGYGTLARIARLPRYILNVWGSDVYDFPYESKIKKYILRRNLDYAYALASTSYAMAEQTRKFVDKGREIAITPFGVDTELFKKQKTMHEGFMFGVVKTLTPKYGIATIINAFAKFFSSVSKEEQEVIYLDVYGKGELLEDLKKMARDLSIEGHVRFNGYIDNRDVPEALNKMDVFLLGSEVDSESFGVAAVEAMACELPVVATKVSGFKEVIEDGKTGYLVEVGDAEKMCEYMLKLYADETLRNTMGHNGRERVKKLYDWDKNVDTMIMLYRKVVEK